VITIDGLTFIRSKSGAAARRTTRIYEVDWAQIVRAEVTLSPSGKPVVWITVADVDQSADSRSHPHAVTLKRRQAELAQEFVALVNEEIDVRSKWALSDDLVDPDRLEA
jgi:hypothetical protein